MPDRGRATTVMRIAVVGSGRMAPGIASVAAATGPAVVVLVGRSLEWADAVVCAAARLGAGRVGAATLDVGGLDSADLVIETVVEDEVVKRDVLAQVEQLAPSSALLATNTSSLPISVLAAELRRPERFARLHVLYPAHVTGVVEVIPGESTRMNAPTSFIRRGACASRIPAEACRLFRASARWRGYLAVLRRGR